MSSRYAIATTPNRVRCLMGQSSPQVPGDADHGEARTVLTPRSEACVSRVKVGELVREQGAQLGHGECGQKGQAQAEDSAAPDTEVAATLGDKCVGVGNEVDVARHGLLERGGDDFYFGHQTLLTGGVNKNAGGFEVTRRGMSDQRMVRPATSPKSERRIFDEEAGTAKGDERLEEDDRQRETGDGQCQKEDV